MDGRWHHPGGDPSGKDENAQILSIEESRATRKIRGVALSPFRKGKHDAVMPDKRSG